MGAGERDPALDSLRGIAAVGILALHAWPRELFWAWSFVDLFFVLSGFLITTILLRVDVRAPRVLRNFWARRVLRIWPVYFIALAAAAGLWMLRSGGGGPDLKWGRCLLFLQFVEGYFGAGLGGYPQGFRHSWTVAAEEQFYILWPFCLLLLRFKPRALAAVCAGLLLVGVAARAKGLPVILLLTRCDGLAAGALLALARSDSAAAAWNTPANRLRLYSVSVALGGALVAPYLIEGYTRGTVVEYLDLAEFGNWSVNVLGFALLYLALVGALVDGGLSRLRGFLGHPGLVTLGILSYAIYMFQGPVRATLHWWSPQADWVEWATIPVTIALAALSRRFVEAPCERLKNRFPLHRAAP